MVDTPVQVSKNNEATSEKLLLELAGKIEKLKQEYGVCKAVYMLRQVYGLTSYQLAKLFNITPNAVTACISYASRSSKALLSIPASSAPTAKEFKEFCGDDAYNVKCQLLEAEIFMYAVAREALPVVAFWDVFVFARIVHRTVFPEVYEYLKSTAILGNDGTYRKTLFRAVRRGEKWYVGVGILAYTYLLLDLALAYRGFHGPQWSSKVRSVVRELTGRDPLTKSMLKLLIPLSHIIMIKLGEKLPEIEKAQEEVYMAMTRKTTL